MLSVGLLFCFLLSIAAAESQNAPLGNAAKGPTSFLLYTRKNVNSSEVVDFYNPKSLAGTNFNRRKPTKVLVHGWTSWAEHKPFPETIKNAYLEAMDVNVIVFDWSTIAFYNYVLAKDFIGILASILAGGLEGLVYAGVKPENIHLIGHSLGAHIAGAVAEVASFKPTRVTGLDPAGPLFTYKSQYRISNNSADFVDIIHTCGMVKGFFEPLGHADFYPNGGRFPQPGCGWDILDLGRCSHQRAPYLFAQSILDQNSFLSTQCSGWREYKEGKCQSQPVIMGEGCPSSARGYYYLHTGGTAPYTLAK